MTQGTVYDRERHPQPIVGRLRLVLRHVAIFLDLMGEYLYEKNARGGVDSICLTTYKLPDNGHSGNICSAQAKEELSREPEAAPHHSFPRPRLVVRSHGRVSLRLAESCRPPSVRYPHTRPTLAHHARGRSAARCCSRGGCSQSRSQDRTHRAGERALQGRAAPAGALPLRHPSAPMRRVQPRLRLYFDPGLSFERRIIARVISLWCSSGTFFSSS